MYNLRSELMHYTNDLLDGADLKAEAVAVIERIAQYMEKDVLLDHSRPLALAYLALTEEVDSVPVVRCKDCKYYKESRVLAPNKFCFRLNHPTEPGKIGYNFSENDFCSRGVRKDAP